MIYAVFLCDKQWNIKKIRQCGPPLRLSEGECLTELVGERDALCSHAEEKQYAVELTFENAGLRVPAVIRSYQEGMLVVLAGIRDNREFLEFNAEYPKYREWAEDHVYGLFHNEYYMIQRMNNQLVDAKRRLVRSNRQLEQTLKENQEINAKLDEARLFAERANRSKTNFLASMSHDIRTPMNAIVGLTELMQHHLNDEAQLSGYIAKIRSSSQYLLDLINDILDLSKIENGSMELKIEPMNIRAQIEQILTIIRPQLTKKHQELVVQCDNLGSQYLMGDPVRLRQVIMNVLSNAVKYTPEGGEIRFAAYELEQTKHRQNYRFEIADNGIGMTTEFLEHIFDPFARAEAAAKEIQGTGLGMAITKNIVDVMGGTIRVDSTPGDGSCFVIDLAFALYDGETAPDISAQVADDGAARVPSDLTGMRFLCAEDNELNAEILASMLEIEGAECAIYSNGRLLVDAFESIQPGDYDAILMDVQMPVMNGYEATAQIRNSVNPLGKTIPIIAMTANAFEEDVRRCLDAGMNAHVAKPIDMESLKHTLSGCIRNGSAIQQ